MAKKATIWFDPRIDGYTIQCAFHPHFIEFLKQSIPASDRSFDPPSKTWRFHKKYLDPVVKSAKAFYGDNEVSVVTEQQVAGAAGAGAGASVTLSKGASLHDVLV